jgi:hypothetical protein
MSAPTANTPSLKEVRLIAGAAADVLTTVGTDVVVTGRGCNDGDDFVYSEPSRPRHHCCICPSGFEYRTNAAQGTPDFVRRPHFGRCFTPGCDDADRAQCTSCVTMPFRRRCAP